LSLNKLARNAGLAGQTISFIEREVQSPTVDTLLRITPALKLTWMKSLRERGNTRRLKNCLKFFKFFQKHHEFAWNLDSKARE